jgi:hypothetical protein
MISLGRYKAPEKDDVWSGHRRRPVVKKALWAIIIGLTLPALAALAAIGPASAATGPASAARLSASTSRPLSHHPIRRSQHRPTPVAAGQVGSVNGSSTAGQCGTAGATGSFTLITARGTTVEVTVTATTTFAEPGVTAATFADVCVGDHAAAVGSDAPTTLTATKVFIFPTPPRPKQSTRRLAVTAFVGASSGPPPVAVPNPPEAGRGLGSSAPGSTPGASRTAPAPGAGWWTNRAGDPPASWTALASSSPSQYANRQTSRSHTR